MVSPNDVTGKDRELIKVLYEGQGWSVAEVKWQGREAVGIRWDGEKEEDIGFPNARGNPVWFVVPDDLADLIRSVAKVYARLKDN
ncbi:MAG: hypothetical protein ACR2PR_02735 [Pseudohongiellaceae bacterium]